MYWRLSRSKRPICGLLAGEGADQAHAGVVFLGLRGDVGEAGLDALEAVVNLAAEVLDEDAGQRHGRQRDQREIGADAQHEEERKDGEEDGIGAVHERRAQQHAHGVQVVGHAGHDVAGAIALVEAGVLDLELAEEVVAQVEFDFARDADEDPALGVEEDAFDEADGDQDQGKDEDEFAAGALLDAVDGHAQNAGELDGDDVGADAGEGAPHVSPAVAAHVAVEGGEVAEHGFIVPGA